MLEGGTGEEVLTTGYLSYLSRGIRPLESHTAGIPARRNLCQLMLSAARVGLCDLWSQGAVPANTIVNTELPFFLPVAQSDSGELYCDFSDILLLSTSWKNLDEMSGSSCESYPSTVAR